MNIFKDAYFDHKDPVYLEKMKFVQHGEMVEAYIDSIGPVDVIKHVHHGYRRDDAAGLMMRFKPRHVIFSCREEGATAYYDKQFPGSGVTLHNCAAEDILFETDGKTLSVGKLK